MKYMISWFERSQGSPPEYENAQKRIRQVVLFCQANSITGQTQVIDGGIVFH